MCFEVLQNGDRIYSTEQRAWVVVVEEITSWVSQKLWLVLAKVKLSCKKGTGWDLSVMMVWSEGRVRDTDQQSFTVFHGTGSAQLKVHIPKIWLVKASQHHFKCSTPSGVSPDTSKCMKTSSFSNVYPHCAARQGAFTAVLHYTHVQCNDTQYVLTLNLFYWI